MASPSSPEGTNPTELTSGPPPRDLYATSDIRFVLVEIGKLSTKVDRLIADVEKQGNKVDAVQDTVTFVKGALWVIGAVTTLSLAIGALVVRLLSSPI